MKMLHLGAGKIGRGLIFPFFRERHEITLADRNPEVVRAIRKNHGYRVIELDYEGPTINNITDPAIQTFQELADLNDVDVITTSVLVSSLVAIAPVIAELAKNSKRPLYIIPMENSLEAPEILSRHLHTHLPSIEGVFVLGSVIDRIVPSLANVVDVECEKYCSVIIEDREGFGELSGDKDILTENIKKEFDKKFLLVNGMHACAAYLGHVRGHKYMCNVMADPVIRGKLELIGGCYMQYLTAVYDYEEKDLVQYLNTSLLRFSNPFLKDPLSRIGRNLLIKLSPGDRIMRPLLYNKQNGLDYAPLEDAVLAAQRFTTGTEAQQYIHHLADAPADAAIIDKAS